MSQGPGNTVVPVNEFGAKPEICFCLFIIPCGKICSAKVRRVRQPMTRSPRSARHHLTSRRKRDPDGGWMRRHKTVRSMRNNRKINFYLIRCCSNLVETPQREQEGNELKGSVMFVSHRFKRGPPLPLLEVLEVSVMIPTLILMSSSPHQIPCT